MRALYILSSGVKPWATGWINTPLDELDERWGAPGGDVRIQAARILSEQDKDLLIVVTGARGNDISNEYKNIDRPNLCNILESGLVTVGVSSKKIIQESQSNNTFEQLEALESVIKNNNFTKTTILTNRYHLERVKAMIETTKLKDLLDKYDVEFLAAEGVLLEFEPARWKEYLENFYHSERFKEIEKRETQGVLDLKNGTYKLH